MNHREWEEVAPRSLDVAKEPTRLVLFLRGAVPGAVIAVLLALLGRTTAAALVAVVSLAVAAGAAVSDRVRATLDRVLHAVGSGVGRLLTLLLLGFVELVVVMPVSALTWLFRRDPLHVAASGDRGWAAHPTESQRALERRLYAIEASTVPTRARRVAGYVPRVVGVIAVALALDLLLGAAWHGAVPDSDRADASVEERIAEATTEDEWFPAYRRELSALRYEFTPFVLSTVDDASGSYINIENGVRRSYEPAERSDLPLVFFFGGSNVWGEGQRDEHTIPSEVARLAEADGLPIRVVNLAQRGDVNFAATLRMERALANATEQPDLVVFGDGPDDFAVQGETPSGDPGQYGLTQAREEVSEDDRSAWERYSEVGLVHRISNRLSGLFGVQPAWAQDSVPGRDPGRDPATDLAEIYERGRALGLDIAADHDVMVRHAWLPIEASGNESSDYATATSLLPGDVIDLTHALDDVDQPVFLDGLRTNELGARAIAVALYAELRPDLALLAPSR